MLWIIICAKYIDDNLKKGINKSFLVSHRSKGPGSDWSEFSVRPLFRTKRFIDSVPASTSWLHFLFVNPLPPFETPTGPSILYWPSFSSDQRGLFLPQSVACCGPAEPPLHLSESRAGSLCESGRTPKWWTIRVQSQDIRPAAASTVCCYILCHTVGAVHLPPGSSVPQQGDIFHHWSVLNFHLSKRSLHAWKKSRFHSVSFCFWKPQYKLSNARGQHHSL